MTACTVSGGWTGAAAAVGGVQEGSKPSISPVSLASAGEAGQNSKIFLACSRAPTGSPPRSLVMPRSARLLALMLLLTCLILLRMSAFSGSCLRALSSSWRARMSSPAEEASAERRRHSSTKPSPVAAEVFSPGLKLLADLVRLNAFMAAFSRSMAMISPRISSLSGSMSSAFCSVRMARSRSPD